MRLSARWSRPVDPRPLAFTRIAVGIGAVVKLFLVAPLLYALADPGAPRLPFLPGFAPALLAPPLMVAIWATSAIALAMGFHTRIAGCLLAATAAVTLVSDWQLYSNHLYLLTLLAALLAVSDAGAALSLDAVRRGRRAVPQFGPDLIRLQISIVYFFAAIWKINPHFLSGWVLGTYVREGVITIPGSFYQPHILAGFALLAIATELLLAFGLWSARLRGPVAVVGIGLHLSFVLLMPQWAELLVFGLLAAGTYPLFLSRDVGRTTMETASATGKTTMRTVRRAGLALLAMMTATACGDSPRSGARLGDDAGMLERSGIRIVVVSHGQASDPFWSVVANGITDAADDLGVRVEYQAPVSFDMVRMSQMIEAAVASMPSALIITVPDADALGGAIRSAKAAGIPVLSINSGAESWETLGMLAHIGQTEYEAAFAGGERLVAAGARSVLCVNHEVGNLAQDERCRGLADALREAGGTSTVLTVDLADPDDAQQRVTNALSGRTAVDGILTLGPAGAVPTLAALRATGRIASVRFGTFDLEADVLTAVRDGDVLFVIDQQPYLQGYLGVTLMVKYLETAGIAGGGQIIRTGPGFVTRDDVDAVIRHTQRGVR